MKRFRLSVDTQAKIIAAFVVTLIIVAMLGLTFFIRAKAPCWMFPLYEAPTRCLPGATQ